VKSMAPRPILFAMANPDPEITPEAAKAACPDVIIATGRSDYPNQINNVLGFPYLFRGALDVRARTINEEMKIAAARAIAALAREDVPDEVGAAYAGRKLRFGPDYIIPVPFDPRLIASIPVAVAKAAMASGVARRPIADLAGYAKTLSARLDPTASTLEAIAEKVRANPKRVVFAEGEEEKSIRAALAFLNAGYGTPVLIGREERIQETIQALGLHGAEALEVLNARLSDRNPAYIDALYARLQRKGILRRDAARMVNQERNIFAALMVALGDADAMVTGLTRSYSVALDQITRIIDPSPGELVFGKTLLIARGRTVFIADTAVHETPGPEIIAHITRQMAAKARRWGHEPRLALLSYSNFGNPQSAQAERVRDAVALLDKEGADFEYDGEMAADVALDPEMMKHYPFCRLKGPANVLIMPGLYSAAIGSKLMQKLGGGTVIGPVLTGLSKPAQIVPMDATVTDILHMALLAAHDALD
ncbi:MAG: NADP-dependent malic enzyme, partial [Rhodospirillales bacterium]